MARGITQDRVDAAADALLQRGERPTIEKVRAELGTGSPNTLIRLIDVWWAGLSARLAAQARANLPELPEPVQRAVMTVWTEAVVAARTGAELVVAERERMALDGVEQARQSIESERQKTSVLQDRLDQTVVDKNALDLLLNDERRRADALQASLSQAVASISDLQTALAASRRDAETAHTTLRADLDRANAAEQRWLREVDRVREELKGAFKAQQALTSSLERERRLHQQFVETTDTERRQLQASAMDLQRALNVSRASSVAKSPRSASAVKRPKLAVEKRPARTPAKK